MAATAYQRGHSVYFDQEEGVWRYADDGSVADYDRPCMRCGKEADMCKWGTHETVTTENGTIGIDACIAHIVRALNNGGIQTKASCCGHGNRPGNIMLDDGRELVICPDYETGRLVDKAFPNIHDKRGYRTPVHIGSIGEEE